MEVASLRDPSIRSSMSAFGFCLEFLVPNDVDIGHPSRFTNGPNPNPILEEVEAMVMTDDRWTILRVKASHPTLFVCVAVDAADEASAKGFLQGAIYDVVTGVIPGAQFVRIDPTNPV
jgi:hypothetical protein